MRITDLSLAGQGAWPELQLEALKPQLNVLFGQPRTGKSTVAQLVSHLLYGKPASAWRQQFGQTIPLAEGSLTVKSSGRSFVLRRHLGTGSCHTGSWQTENCDSGNDATGRLTITATDDAPVDGQTVRAFLSGLSPEMAMHLFAVDFAEPPRIEWLFSETFAREFTHRLPGENTKTSRAGRSGCHVHTDSEIDFIDRRRVEELIHQRDSIAEELEQKVGVRRRESDGLERELRDIEATLEGKREQSSRLQVKLRGMESELAEIETRLRFLTLGSRAQHLGSRLTGEQHRQQLTELDTEITVCRKTLGDLQSREKAVRTDLAQISPDGTADSVTCLVDGRMTLVAMEQLLDDLDAEVAQLARANEPGRCIGHESHARMVPVTSLLRQQVYTLCGQFTEQQRIAHRQQLTAEIRQLERLQSNMGERLELLLSRRESLVRQAQTAGQANLFAPPAPVAGHCLCDHHGQFVEQTHSMAFVRTDLGEFENEAHGQHATIERSRVALIDELTAVKLDMDRLEGRWKELQGERTHLLGGSVIEKQQAELGRLEIIIKELLHSASPVGVAEAPATWRASDVLAQLTSGNLVQIRLERQNQRAMVVDRSGHMLSVDSLTAAQHDLLYIALTLALVSSYAQRGTGLPLLLDEPFLRQDAAASATLAGVLDEFARAGHQVLVVTEDHGARSRFSGLGSALFDLEELRRHQPASSSSASFAAALTTKKTVEPAVTTSTRVVRETFGAPAAPALRLAAVSGHAIAGRQANDRGASKPLDWQSRQAEDLVYLSESSSWEDFPILGSETTALFGLIDISSVGDLLSADPAETARQLHQPDITEETVRLWQSHMGLMCYVPGLSLNDAQLLTAVGMDSPDDLSEADLDQLWRGIENFLSSARGRQFASSRNITNRAPWSRSQLSSWRDGARRNRQRWQNSRSNQSTRGRTRSQQSRTRSNGKQSDRDRDRRTQRSTEHSQRQKNREWRFTLSRENDVKAAPSIGPKTASRLAQAGIRSVADLLSANPESVAEELDVSHIQAKTVAAWQHQARLVCQIPELPGYGAQLLVANGFTEPEQVAGSSIDELVGKLLAFCQTKEGQRIIRSGDAPERDKIAEWIECAAHRRPLEAA